MNGNRGKKPPFISSTLAKKVEKIMKSGGKPEIKTYDRGSTITPKLVGFTLLVHNGKAFSPLYINEDMIGHKIGEFVLTRHFKAHGGAKTPAGGKK